MTIHEHTGATDQLLRPGLLQVALLLSLACSGAGSPSMRWVVTQELWWTWPGGWTGSAC